MTVVEEESTLFLGPLKILGKNPHACAGFLMRYAGSAFDFLEEKGGGLIWKRNPLRMLADLYYYLSLEARAGALPVQQIWAHDQELLQRGLEFYTCLEKEYLEIDTEPEFRSRMQGAYIHWGNSYKDFEEALYTESSYKKKLSAEEIEKCQTLHKTWSLAVPLLNVLLYAGKNSGILEICMDESLRPIFPEKFLSEPEEKSKKETSTSIPWKKALSPPPLAAANTIVAESGGTFYAREEPSLPPYLKAGSSFKKGDPIYIIEVMKMFNKVYAEFSGKVTEVLLEDKEGTVIKKGEPLFYVEPEEKIHIETEAEKGERRRLATEELWKRAPLTPSFGAFP